MQRKAFLVFQETNAVIVSFEAISIGMR